MRPPALRIVVVDAHGVVRRGVRALLESRAGWKVVAEMATGREALEAVRRYRPEIVVMDLCLRELNSVDAARQIVSESPHTEVLVLTMHHSEELAREMLKTGARGYVLKSDAADHLIAAVEALRQHKPFLTSSVTEFVRDGFLKTAIGPEHRSKNAVTPREREVVQRLAEGSRTRRPRRAWASASRRSKRIGRTSCGNCACAPLTSCATPSATRSTWDYVAAKC